MHAPSLISVVLCCHNGARTLERSALGAREQSYTGDWELVFVDDGSTDDSASIAESWSDRLPIRIVSASQSGDAGGACSRAECRRGRSTGRPAAVLRRRRRRGSGLDRRLRGRGARGGEPWEASTRRNCSTIHACAVGASRGLRAVFRSRSGWSPVPSGGNSGVWSVGLPGGRRLRRRVLRLPGEEIDFFWRVQLAGYDVRYVPDAIMHIRHRNSLKALARQSYRYGARQRRCLPPLPAPGHPRHLGHRRRWRVAVRIVRGVPKAHREPTEAGRLASDDELRVRPGGRKRAPRRLVRRLSAARAISPRKSRRGFGVLEVGI